MKPIIALYLQFTGREFSTLHRVLSMVPGFFIFLVVSPFVIFKIAVSFSKYIPVTVPRTAELFIIVVFVVAALSLMTWALFELWTRGKGTPAPITPTGKLVTTGPYSWCRNPIELGTNIYFLVLGTYFDSFVTGILCMFFGLLLGIAYIKFIEEKEMLIRFGAPYDEYLHSVPFMIPFSLPGLNKDRK